MPKAARQDGEGRAHGGLPILRHCPGAKRTATRAHLPFRLARKRAAAPIARLIHGATGAGVCFPDAGAACTPLFQLERTVPAIREQEPRRAFARQWPGRPPFRRGAFRVRAVYHSGSAFARRFDYIAGRFCPLRHKTAHLYRRADFLHFTFLQFAHIINHEGHESLRTCRGARRRG